MIATVCRSCKTVSLAITDRCKWCGSQCVDVKFVDDNLVDKRSSKRYILKELEVKT